MSPYQAIAGRSRRVTRQAVAPTVGDREGLKHGHVPGAGLARAARAAPTSDERNGRTRLPSLDVPSGKSTMTSPAREAARDRRVRLQRWRSGARGRGTRALEPARRGRSPASPRPPTWRRTRAAASDAEHRDVEPGDVVGEHQAARRPAATPRRAPAGRTAAGRGGAGRPAAGATRSRRAAGSARADRRRRAKTSRDQRGVAHDAAPADQAHEERRGPPCGAQRTRLMVRADAARRRPWGSRPAAGRPRESRAAVKGQRRRVALLDLEMHGAHARLRELLEVAGEQRAGAWPRPRASGGESDGEDLGLVRGAARQDEAVGLAAARRGTARRRRRCLSASSRSNSSALQGRAKALGMDRGEPRGVAARRAARSARRLAGRPNSQCRDTRSSPGSRAVSCGLASGPRR